MTGISGLVGRSEGRRDAKKVIWTAKSCGVILILGGLLESRSL